jgi:LysR family glycine cleavage system transcriptional activator
MTQRNALPPLKSLIAAEAVVRNGSVVKAANELNLTSSAISQQIRVLEGAMKLSLFQRHQGKISLNVKYADYFREVSRSLDILQSAGESLNTRAEPLKVCLSVVPSFASLCLIPKIHEFNSKYPEIQLSIISSLDLAHFGTDQVDLSIRYTATTQDKSLVYEKLCDDYLLPCASKQLIEQAGTDDLTKLVKQQLLIQDISSALSDVKPDWKDWLPSISAEHSNLLGFTDYQHVVQAGLNHQGLFIARSGLAIDPKSNTDLVPLSQQYLQSGASFYLVYSSHVPMSPSVRLLRNWLFLHFSKA